MLRAVTTASLLLLSSNAVLGQFQGSVVEVRLPQGHASAPQQPSSNSNNNNAPPQPAAAAIPIIPPPPPPSRQADSPPLVEVPVANDAENEVGFVDSVFGEGTQGRIVTTFNEWVSRKAKEHPGCVERLVCEAYRSGETMEGIPYLLMQVSNAALSFMVAEMFDNTIEVRKITKAARYGRTMGQCRDMQCELADSQLRTTIGGYVDAVDDFLTSVVQSISDSIGKRR